MPGTPSRLMEEEIGEMDQERENQDQPVIDNQEIQITISGTTRTTILISSCWAMQCHR